MTEKRTFTGHEARLLLRRARTGTLASLNREDGIPYASLVNVATDVGGEPLILISGLAWHTRNLMSDGRASLLVAEPPASGDALTGPRVTVMGRFVKTAEERIRRRYLARHPEASFYAGFGDFAFWRLEPERAHAVAGFGRIETLGKDEVFPSVDEFISIEDGAVQHMNEDHADAVALLAEKDLGGSRGGWRMAAIDPDGADLVKDGEPALRLPFPEPVASAGELRAMLARMTRNSRNR